LLDWLYTAVSWVLKEWHTLFSSFLPADGGITWALSIIFLVVTIRVLLFRLFIRQVKSQRAMQEIQPEIQKLKKQYGADRQGFSQAVMALQKERGVNPLAGCLPILPQIPVFISLFHVLRGIAPGAPGLYGWSDALAAQAAAAKLFGAPISASFIMQEPKASAVLALTGGSYTPIRVVALALIVIMCATTFFTQKQIMARSGPVEGQAATVQRLMLYGMPLSLLVSGFFFPIGVLLYWFTNNLWTLGQQFYILRKMPPPGSPAAKAKEGAKEGDAPAADSRTLAPRPGAKPVRDRSGRAAQPAAEAAEPAAQPQDGSEQEVVSGDAAAPPAESPVLNGVPVEDGAGAGPPAGSRPNGSGATRPRNKAGQGSGNRPKRKRR
jgi:YidC/Oxa1 family membrane protein insertase